MNKRGPHPQKAEPAEAWQGVRDGTKDPVQCLSIDPTAIATGIPKTTGTEDCLRLNVFTPKVGLR